MTRTKSLRRRQLLILFCALLLFGSMFPLTVFAADVAVSTTNSTAYFQTFSSKGVWVDIGTPLHTVNGTGQVAYCLQTDYSSPSGSGYSSIDGADYYDQTTLNGLRAILENGYPTSDGGFGADQARYATANAIRFFLAERGAEGVPAWMDQSRYSQFFRAKSGYEALFNWCLSLLECARAQNVTSASLVLDPATVTLRQEENGFVGEVSVTLKNCSGYELDFYTMPFELEVDGYTGKSGDVLTIRAPLSYAGRTVEFYLDGGSSGGAASLLFFAPHNYGEQRLLVYDVNVYGTSTSAKLTAIVPEMRELKGSLKICKVDAETGKPLPGASFNLYDANGNLYTSGITDANGVLEFTAPPGRYYYMETAAPEGYAIDSEKHPVNIEDGRTESITAANAPIHKGCIRVKKVDAYGNTMSGAVFALEASTDGGNTYAVIGIAETDDSGIAVFPELTVKDTLYRLTETKAPPGHSLQAGTIFEGALSDDRLDLSFTVCDCAIPMLPFTGNNNYIVIYFALMLGMGFFVIQILKRRNTFEETV